MTTKDTNVSVGGNDISTEKKEIDIKRNIRIEQTVRANDTKDKIYTLKTVCEHYFPIF